MFCPKCKTEYREGFYKCADCEVDLVYELPAEVPEYNNQDDEVECGNFVELLRAYNDGEIAFLKSLLDTTDIPYHFRSSAFRISRLEQPPAILMIEESHMDEANELLKDFKNKSTES